MLCDVREQLHGLRRVRQRDAHGPAEALARGAAGYAAAKELTFLRDLRGRASLRALDGRARHHRGDSFVGRILVPLAAERVHTSINQRGRSATDEDTYA